ncbi:MAG: sugar phosphate isomerase/epimerase [Rhizobiaceae bacterium]|nr:sugar phosphate isomerase/epimerase [Rhizobiaceae bacterium]
MYGCFHSVGIPDKPILAVVERVAAVGYPAIELNAETLPWAPAHVSPGTTRETRQGIIDACRSSNITIPAVGAHLLMVSADKAERQAAIDYVNGCIDLAVDVNSPVVHILSGPQATEGTYDDGWRWFAEAVEKTTDYAKRHGVELAVEAIAGHLFHSIDDYKRLFSDLGGVPFKINFDPSHLEVQGEDPARLVEELGEHIVHVHLKDGLGRYPDFSFPPLDEGTIDFAGLIPALARSGYDGALSIEYEAQVFGWKQDEQTILDHGIAFLRRFGIQMRNDT